MLSPFAASNPNSGEDQLHPQPQQDLYTQQLGCPSKLSFNLQSGAYPALSSRASKLFNSDLSRYGNASFHGVSQPFGHSESLHANNNLPNSKMLNYGSYTPSNTLSSTDLRFSGYILGSTSEINRSNHSYNGPSSACAVTACDSSTNHFKMLGTSDTQSQPTQYAGGRLSAAGASGLSVSSTPYHECSSFGTMSMARYDPCSSYSSLLNKANLLFDNNLESMTVEW
ncbi:hypothetical protein COEREDRAFT_88525 [Coemansia reversa NRRL 1564]|uniref:Uncharacterized protein n=1 Tax=Coemansia reversa (strain ATCC 12441 / NRRL 1564) TaxID=763665 RepID=A0A2G5B6R4_COERN|nr:hypothetical protein COEREDRAFT_88525 [Coemansia reversa NRRL 1564]|eukprot:PIA14706.1 hypothetical protein COEREDRAFT_88525 [Coemansia reversa NRRL 1564]